VTENFIPSPNVPTLISATALDRLNSEKALAIKNLFKIITLSIIKVAPIVQFDIATLNQKCQEDSLKIQLL
jgi:hypothetical protein